ncbi:uncharacterized protein LOC111641652 [Centruroides sculpturatus]|uniref:uncharacterized protein LOC111641652 n=1 Tax=Centruroides sculpturatus TaxID=218467 RepID=UPI000C6E97A8|nr:uncharacterized protein LOC111641652 [Centruroides sculpturatus]
MQYLTMKNSAKNLTIRTAVVPLPVLVELREEGNKIVFSGHGSIARLLLTIQEVLGFSFEIKIIKDYGMNLKNGSWTGRIGSLHRNESDITVPHAMSYQHSKLIDFTIPYWISDIIFCLRKGEQKSKLYAITYPFHIEVWIATIMTFFVGSIFFYLIFNVSAKFYSDKKTSLHDIVMALFASFTNKENNIFQPAGESRKLLVIMWILAVSTLVYSYSGCLMSFLSFPGLEDVPRTFPDLFQAVKNGHYTLSTNMKSVIGVVIKKGETESTATMKKFLTEGKLVEIEKRHFFERMFAIISFSNIVLFNVKTIGEENYLSSTDNLFMQFVSFGLRKNFPLKTEFDQILRRCLEAGLQEKFVSDEILRYSNERQSLFVEPDDFRPLTLNDLFGSFRNHFSRISQNLKQKYLPAITSILLNDPGITKIQNIQNMQYLTMKNSAKNLTIRAAVVPIPALVGLRVEGNKIVFSGHGSIAKLLLTIQEVLGFRCGLQQS